MRFKILSEGAILLSFNNIVYIMKFILEIYILHFQIIYSGPNTCLEGV